MRVAKWPFNTFQANMLKAQALATTQQYLNRFLAEGPDRFMESYMAEWMALTKEVLGFDLLAEMQGPIMRYMEEHLAKRLPKVTPQVDDEKAKKLEEQAKRLAEPILAVVNLRGQTLLEQAVVLGVTAYETYFTDTVEAMFRLNPKLLDRFTKELDKGLKWSGISRHGKDAREAAMDFILQEYKALELGKVKNLFARLARIENVFGDEDTERSIRKFIEYRHIIVHRAGKVDRKFQEVTGSRQARDTFVELTTTYVAEGLEKLSSFVASVQARLEALSGGTTETEPPE